MARWTYAGSSFDSIIQPARADPVYDNSLQDPLTEEWNLLLSPACTLFLFERKLILVFHKKQLWAGVSLTRFWGLERRIGWRFS